MFLKQVNPLLKTFCTTEDRTAWQPLVLHYSAKEYRQEAESPIGRSYLSVCKQWQQLTGSNQPKTALILQNQTAQCVTSGFHRGVSQIHALLEFYAA
jgi:hypothetical protein